MGPFPSERAGKMFMENISYGEERNDASVFAKGEFYISLKCLSAIVKYIIRHLIKMNIVRTEGPRVTSCFMK